MSLVENITTKGPKVNTYEVRCNDGVSSTDWGSVKVEANSFTVEENGTLVFFDGERVAAFGGGQWISVRLLKCAVDGPADSVHHDFATMTAAAA